MTRRLVAALCLVALLLPCRAGGGEQRIAVIVHRDRRDALDTPTVARIYLRKQRFWDDGSPIIPLNREAGNPLREAFSKRVLGVGSEKLSAYWNEQYFHGVLPPPTLSSSQAVARFVASEPNAIGYVEEGVVDSSVRVAAILE
jgi:ABC-type phosphate transport system substrate-binding protein